MPLKKLFLESKDEFLRLHADQRFSEKHLIGAAMWKWLCEASKLSPELREQGEEIHFRRKKEKGGLPLWRLVFKATLRNTPEIDALFVGPRLGPTPRYARLAEAGVLPASPEDFEPATSVGEPRVAPAEVVVPAPRYPARDEWVLDDVGNEWLYVYTLKRELDNFASAGIEPLLKVGQTRQHYTQRMAAQIGSTSSHSPFVCLLAYRVRDAQQLETAVHKVLKVQDRHVRDAPGIEWFQITPEALHQLVQVVAGMALR
ncbi:MULTISPECIES: GIY-YIG nuclease family protein [unclassified Variovorax]|uniref:GIY-YIG nuclease family protein n=1 Tax=unclassified Variovorax TaxID=663243 RepID=UPI0015E1544C|nr:MULTISPECIES: GIY-YIG nuclease family protein [unclassified Variovorax]